MYLNAKHCNAFPHLSSFPIFALFLSIALILSCMIQFIYLFLFSVCLLSLECKLHEGKNTVFCVLLHPQLGTE